MSDSFRIMASPGFGKWLGEINSSLAFSTYQLGKLFFIGSKPDGRLSVFERTFNRCLGLWSDAETLWLASAFQLWRLENVLTDGKTTRDGYDQLYVPREAYTTGDLDIHDVVQQSDGQLVFVNTLFCCLATRCERYNFRPVWQPPFIDRLAAEDRCHLNGLATKDGKAKYVTVCSQTNRHHGWREQRSNGGCVIDIETNEVLADGLSMPHSPRVYRDELWLLNSGGGYFGRVNQTQGGFEPMVFCPGYARGLTFIDKYAVIGLSKPREATFSGLPLDQELAHRKVQPGCGLLVIDIERQQPVEWLQIEGKVDELYDVITLPGVRRPKAFGLKTDEIRHNVWFQEQNGDVSSWSADV